MLQTFDPPGVCARNLSRMPGHPARASATGSIRRWRRCSTISTCWRSATSRRCDKLCGVDDDDLVDMIAEIKRARPQARPRLRLRAGAAGRARRLRAAGRRRRLARRAQLRHPAARAGQPDLLRARSRSSAEERRRQDFLADCLQTANWLVRSLDQRAQTILKVATEIVRQQDAFLAHGVAHLRPLNLQDRRRRDRACTNRRSPASPPTSTWRRRAACSS